MSEMKKKVLENSQEKEKREQAWSDSIPDEEEERPSPYELTYRDGTLVNECWHRDDA